MALRLDDWFIWDFWLAPRLGVDEPFHCLFLQAPRSLGDPELRHDRAQIGHATSSDLVNWEYHGIVLPLGPEGSWDSFTHWTGSVIRDGGLAYLFYTGRNTAEAGNVQRIGVATSSDLWSWDNVGREPVVEAVEPWYVAPTADGRTRSDCRDPWIIRHDGRWLMYFTASAAGVPRSSCGVVGLAESSDLVHWTVHPPVAGPGQFEEIEVPQVFPLGDRWAMVFCTAKHATVEGPRASWIGTHYMVADTPFGPFELAPEPLLLADPAGTDYAARIVLDPWAGTQIMAFRRTEPDGSFGGYLIDPIPVVIDPTGHRLTVQR